MKVTKHFFESDILEIEAFDKFGHSMCTWTWPVHYANDYFERENREYHKVGEASCVEEGNNVTLSADGIYVSFDKLTGKITEVLSKGRKVSFGNGPVAVGMCTKLKGSKIRKEGNNAVFTVWYQGGVNSIRWVMDPEDFFRWMQ